MNAWTNDARTADAIDATAGLTRERLTARLTFLAAGLSDDALRELVIAAEGLPQRRLDRQTLGDEQRAREACTT